LIGQNLVVYFWTKLIIRYSGVGIGLALKQPYGNYKGPREYEAVVLLFLQVLK
jgi:hypothetical protein